MAQTQATSRLTARPFESAATLPRKRRRTERVPRPGAPAARAGHPLPPGKGEWSNIPVARMLPAVGAAADRKNQENRVIRCCSSLSLLFINTFRTETLVLLRKHALGSRDARSGSI